MKQRNIIAFWVFLTQYMRGMQKWFANIHQRPGNHEPHSTMSRRFIELEVLLCSSFLEASVLGNQDRKKCKFYIFQIARPLGLFSYVGAVW